LQLSDLLDLNLGLGHVTYHPLCITYRPISTYQILLKSEKLVVDGQMDETALLARLKGVNLKIGVYKIKLAKITLWRKKTLAWPTVS